MSIPDLPPAPLKWENQPSTATPFDAEVLNPWGEQIRAIGQAARDYAIDARQSATDAGAPTDQMINNILTTPDSQGRQTLDAAYALAAHSTWTDDVPAPHETNIVLGSPHNGVSTGSGDAAVLSGGRDLCENVIGGLETNVDDNFTSNIPEGGPDQTVVADYSVIIGGYDNVNNALASFVAGQHCLISRNADHSSILGGSKHKILTGSYHAINGGVNHYIDTAEHGATIGGGRDNTIGGPTLIAGWSTISGGRLHTATATYATIGGGYRNEVTAEGGTVVGGVENVVTQPYATAVGRGASPSQRGSLTLANTQFSTKGDAQTETVVIRRETTDATTSILSSHPTALPDDASWVVRAMIVAKNTSNSVQETAAWELTYVARRVGTGNIALVGTPTVTKLAADSGASSWTIALRPGATPIHIDITGQAGKTIRWVGRMDIVQVIG